MNNSYLLYRGFKDLGDSLGSGLRGLGRGDLDRAKMALYEARTMDDLATRKTARERGNTRWERENEQWAAGAPGRELSQMKSETALADAKKPFSALDLAADPRGAMFLFRRPDKGKGSSINDEIAKAWGVTYVTDQDNPTFGQYIKADGTPLLRGEITSGQAQQAYNIFTSRVDLPKALQDKHDRLADELDDPNITPKRAGEIQTELEQIGTLAKEPAKMFEALQQQERRLSGLGDMAKPQLERVRKQMDQARRDMDHARDRRERKEDALEALTRTHEFWKKQQDYKAANPKNNKWDRTDATTMIKEARRRSVTDKLDAAGEPLVNEVKATAIFNALKARGGKVADSISALDPLSGAYDQLRELVASGSGADPQDVDALAAQRFPAYLASLERQAREKAGAALAGGQAPAGPTPGPLGGSGATAMPAVPRPDGGGGSVVRGKVAPSGGGVAADGPDISNLFVDDRGIIWENRNGQPVRVMTPERPERRLGNKVYSNPDYEAYKQLLDSIQAMQSVPAPMPRR